MYGKRKKSRQNEYFNKIIKFKNYEQTNNYIHAAGELPKGAHCLAKGAVLVTCSIGGLINQVVSRYPWAVVALTLVSSLTISFACISSARSERDATNKRNYELQQKIERLQMAKDAKAEV